VQPGHFRQELVPKLAGTPYSRAGARRLIQMAQHCRSAGAIPLAALRMKALRTARSRGGDLGPNPPIEKCRVSCTPTPNTLFSATAARWPPCAAEILRCRKRGWTAATFRAVHAARADSRTFRVHGPFSKPTPCDTDAGWRACAHPEVHDPDRFAFANFSAVGRQYLLALCLSKGDRCIRDLPENS